MTSTGASDCWVSPVALPGVPHIHVVDVVFVRLLVQEVKHVLDGQRQGRAAAHRAEQSLKQVVHKLLERPLQKEKIKSGSEPWNAM